MDEHRYLDSNDECFYYGEFTAGMGFSHSETNQLIHNFKKTIDRKELPEWRYKEVAIKKIAELIRNSLNKSLTITLVPTPPSKAKDDLLYDNRIPQALDLACRNLDNIEFRELVVQKTTLPPFHVSGNKLGPGELVEVYKIDSSLIAPAPERIIVVDDVITTGSHFKAMKTILSKQYPNALIKGIFIARRVPERLDPAVFED